MSDWMDGYQHAQRWLSLAAKLEGLIDAHQMLKGDGGDVYDEMLWRVASGLVKEAEDAGL